MFTQFFETIVEKLDRDYWITHCGCDGYLYLLFQRRFLKLLIWFSVISMLVSIPVNVTSEIENIEKKSTVEEVGDWFERTTLNNKELGSFKGWVHVALIMVFTILTVRVIMKTRREARQAYQFYQRSMSKTKDHEWLKARTIHVKGLSPEDRSGAVLKQQLENVIAAGGGHVLAVHLVPDFVSQLELESKILDMKDLQMLVNAQDSSGNEVYFNCCIPR